VKLIAKTLFTSVFLSTFIISPAFSLESSDPNFRECSRYESLQKEVLYINFVVDFAQFISSKNLKTKKQKLEHKKLLVEQKKLRESVQVYGSDVACESLTVSQWLSIKEDRNNSLKTAEEYITKMMQKYPFTTIQCFKNGIPQDVRAINPVCPKGTKQI
jgi:hypothetical protein